MVKIDTQQMLVPFLVLLFWIWTILKVFIEFFIILPYLFLFLNFIYFLSKDNCFIEFCCFLSHLNMNQPQAYIYPLPFEPPSLCHPSRFYGLIFWPWGMWDLSSPPRDQTHTPCIEKWSLNHWTSSEVPQGCLRRSCDLSAWVQNWELEYSHVTLIRCP